ncbi:MAG: hypothetical protein K6F41_09340 [Lachnospira sp.]|nr:hypothetical protein [Lachnospira sp.]
MSENTNKEALLAAKDEQKRSDFIAKYEQAILRTASSSSHKYVTKEEDEWSIALVAFSKAIDSYSEDKGDFLPFAMMLVKRALIDYYRQNKKHENELSISPNIMNGGQQSEEDLSLHKEISKASLEKESNLSKELLLKDEIEGANEMLKEYGFSFYDLTKASPKQDKTKEICAEAIRCILNNKAYLEELEAKKKLPIKALSKEHDLSKKILDRYRKYIIMAVLILSKDYPLLAVYLKFVRKEE